MNSHRMGLTLATFAFVVHLVWVVLVAIGLAQPLHDFVAGIHFIEPMTITPFDLVKAVEVLVLAPIVAYVFGRLIGEIWNRMKA